jgi:hypothetical protein
MFPHVSHLEVGLRFQRPIRPGRCKGLVQLVWRVEVEPQRREVRPQGLHTSECTGASAAVRGNCNAAQSRWHHVASQGTPTLPAVGPRLEPERTAHQGGQVGVGHADDGQQAQEAKAVRLAWSPATWLGICCRPPCSGTCTSARSRLLLVEALHLVVVGVPWRQADPSAAVGATLGRLLVGAAGDATWRRLLRLALTLRGAMSSPSGSMRGFCARQIAAAQRGSFSL